MDESHTTNTQAPSSSIHVALEGFSEFEQRNSSPEEIPQFIEAQSSSQEEQILIPQPRKSNCSSYAKRIALGTTMLVCLTASTVGIAYLYSNASESISEMRGSCDVCTEKLENTEEFINQAQSLIKLLSQSAPTINELSSLFKVIKPFLAAIQTCHPDLKQILSAVNILCNDNSSDRLTLE